MTAFSENLQRLRKEKGLTQNGLAEQLGVSPQAVSKWENSSYPDADFIPKIADYFEVSIDQLYGRGQKKMSLEENIYKNILKGLDAMDQHWTEEGKAATEEYFKRCLEYNWAAMNGSFTWQDRTEYRNKPVRDSGDNGSALIRKEGIYFMSNRRACEFAMVMKRPMEGFKEVFENREKTAELFAWLGKEDNLKLLEFMFTLKQDEVIQAKVIAAKTGIEKEVIENFFETINKVVPYSNFFAFNKIVCEQGDSDKAYSINIGTSSIFILLLALSKMIIYPTRSFEPLTVQYDCQNESLI